MLHIDDTSVMVEDLGELETVLSSADGYTLIYLGADITLTRRITINNARTSAIIDGFYPPDETGTTHLLTGGNSDLYQIFTASTSAQDITFQNMDIFVYNYYGIFRTNNVASAQDISVTFRNITFTGPQLVWHPRGSTHIDGCDITIQRNGTGSYAQEVGEVNRISIGGVTMIRHNSTDHPTFYLYQTNASFTLLDDAKLTVITEHTFLRRDANIPFIIGKRAEFYLTTEQAFAYLADQAVSSFLIDQDAVFHYIRLSSSGAARAIYVNGPFTVNEGATVYLQAAYTAAGALVRFMSTTTSLQLNNPKSFVLYKGGTGSTARAMSFAAQIDYEINGGQINYWINAAPLSTAGTFSDEAPDRWHRPDWSSFMIKGRASDSLTTVTEKTITDEDLSLLPTPLSNMHLRDARVFSVGNLPLTIGPVIDDGRPLTGATEPGANTRVEYAQGGAEYPKYGTADANGDFSFVTSQTLPLSDTLSFSSNTPFLIVTLEYPVTDPGALSFSYVPVLISFEFVMVRTFPVILYQRMPMSASNPNLVVVSDTRADRTPWGLWASLTGPLQSSDSTRILNNAVVMVPFTGDMITLTTEPTLVYRSEATPYRSADTEILWPSFQGPLGQIEDAIWSGVEYETHLVWELRPILD